MNNKKPPQNQNQSVMQVQQAFFHGPIPPADALTKYESAFPGSAERIFKMAEKEQENRLYIEKKKTDSASTAILRGQMFGFVFMLLVLVSGVGLIVVGKEIGGIASLLTAAGFAIFQVLYKKYISKPKPANAA